MLVKDNFDTVGMVATAGSIALMDNFPQRDAQPVRPRQRARSAPLCHSMDSAAASGCVCACVVGLDGAWNGPWGNLGLLNQGGRAVVADMVARVGILKHELAPAQVERLRAAGGIVLAKANMGEWALSPLYSVSSAAGVVRNPYDTDRVPAGSSGGVAAGAHPPSLHSCSVQPSPNV